MMARRGTIIRPSMIMGRPSITSFRSSRNSQKPMIHRVNRNKRIYPPLDDHSFLLVRES